MTDTSLSEDAFVFGDGVMKKKETVTLEKKVYDVLLKRNADLMDENILFRSALKRIIDRAEIEESKASNAIYGFAYDIEMLSREALKEGKDDRKH